MFHATPKVVSLLARAWPLRPSPSHAIIDGQKHDNPAPNTALNTRSKPIRVVSAHASAMSAAMTQPTKASFRRPTRSDTRPVTSASAAYRPIQTAPNQPRSDALAPAPLPDG